MSPVRRANRRHTCSTTHNTTTNTRLLRCSVPSPNLKRVNTTNVRIATPRSNAMYILYSIYYLNTHVRPTHALRHTNKYIFSRVCVCYAPIWPTIRACERDNLQTPSFGTAATRARGGRTRRRGQPRAGCWCTLERVGRQLRAPVCLCVCGC